MANRHGKLHPGTIAAIVLAVAAIMFIAGSYSISDNMNKTADAVGSSSGQSHQPRPNNLQNQPAGDARGKTGSSGIQVGRTPTFRLPAGSGSRDELIEIAADREELIP